VVKQYIEHQREHHGKHSFEDEFVSLLRESGVPYDPKFVLGLVRSLWDSNFAGKRTRHFRAGLSYAAAARLEHFARQASRRKVDSESRRTFENWIYVTPSESLVTNPCKI
jgi:hypothetical protein